MPNQNTPRDPNRPKEMPEDSTEMPGQVNIDRPGEVGETPEDEASVSVPGNDPDQRDKNTRRPGQERRDLGHGGATSRQPGRGGGLDLPEQAPNEPPAGGSRGGQGGGGVA